MELSKTFDGLDYIAKCARKVEPGNLETHKIELMCTTLEDDSKELKSLCPYIAIVEGLHNIANSAREIRRLIKARSPLVYAKKFCELIPLISEVTYDVYFFTQIFGKSEAEKEHYKSEYFEMNKNNYPQKHLASIVVLAYNKLEYTKKCVESILEYTPDIDYELILLNNGSSDGTKEYFDSLHVAKTINLKENSLSNIRLYSRITEGKYILSVNNDVVVTQNYLDNLLACMESDTHIGMCVPTTPNISNNQSIPYTYTDDESMQEFACEYNTSNPALWEDRIRLCNPIALMRADAVQAVGEHDSYFPFGEFSDDALSYRLRSNGWRLVLCKDTYCHHYGSITLGEGQREHNTLGISRALFERRYGFDAWGNEILNNICPPIRKIGGINR